MIKKIMKELLTKDITWTEYMTDHLSYKTNEYEFRLHGNVEDYYCNIFFSFVIFKHNVLVFDYEEEGEVFETETDLFKLYNKAKENSVQDFTKEMPKKLQTAELKICLEHVKEL